MKYFILALSLLFFTACNKGTKAETKAQTIVEEVAPPADAQVYEVSCGKCIYKVEGTKGCPIFIKTDEKTFLPLKNSNISAHNSGLCSKTGKALISGKVENGQFIADYAKLTTSHVHGENCDHEH